MGNRLLRNPAQHPVLMPLLGILLYRLSAYSVYGSAYTTAVTAFTYSRLAQLLATALLVVYAWKRRPTARRMRRLVATGSLVMLAGAALSVGFEPATAPFTAGRILHGIGAAVLFVGWGAYTCTLAPRHGALGVSGAFALYGIATFALQDAPAGVGNTLALAVPVLCGALLMRCLANTDASPSPSVETGPAIVAAPSAQAQSGTTGGQGTIPWDVVGLLVACSLTCAVTELFVTPDASTLATYTANVFRIPVFCGIALFFIAWVRLGRKDNPDQLWALFALVIACGLLGYSSFSPFNPAVALAFMRATQDCLMMFAWIWTSGVAWRCGLAPLATFGLATIVFMRTDLPASLVRLAIPDFAVAWGALATTMLTFTLALALIVYAIVLANRHPLASCRPAESRALATGGGPTSADNGASGAEGEMGGDDRTNLAATGAGADTEPPAAHSTDGDNGSDLWAGRFGLSARECQVVELLLHGYTLPQLAERLGISLNTARWYAKGIYRKLAIHSKGELIELAEELRG